MSNKFLSIRKATLILLFFSFFLHGCQALQVEVQYHPPIIPLTVSVGSAGEISISSESPSIVTPIGIFSVGVVVDPMSYFNLSQDQNVNILIIRFDGKDHFYRLDGQDFDITFASGYYEKVNLSKQGQVILLILQRATTPAQANATTSTSLLTSSHPPAVIPLSPTSLPSSSSPPTPSTCSIPVDQEFQGVWQRAGGVAAGCPLGAAYQKKVAFEPFENGFMIWTAGPYGDAGGMIYVVYNSGNWQEYRDEWVEGMPEDPGYSPPPGLVEPKRGFGHLWAKLGGPNAAIGWATDVESGSDFGKIQEFPNNAAIIRVPYKITIFLPDGKRWVD